MCSDTTGATPGEVHASEEEQLPRRLEDGKEFQPTVSPARSMFQESFKIDTEEGPSDPTHPAMDSAVKTQSGEDLEDWLGGRDSNPDCTVQSRVSYH